MKKIISVSLLVILLLCGIWASVHPYNLDIKGVEYAPDVVFENTPTITDASVTIDFSQQKNDETIINRINAEYAVENQQTTKAILPFCGSLYNLYYLNHDLRNIEIKANESDVPYQMFYGSCLTGPAMSITDMSYEDLNREIRDEIVEDNDDVYYTYIFNDIEDKIGISNEIVDNISIFVSNLEIAQLNRRERKKLEDTEYKNHTILKPSTEGPSVIITKNDIAPYLTKTDQVYVSNGSYECYSNLLSLLYKDIDVEGAIRTIQYEIDILFSYQLGINIRSLDDLIYNNRYVLYVFDVPANCKLSIAYNNLAGRNNTFEKPRYEGSFQIRKENYTKTEHFLVQFILDEENRYVNFSTQKNLVENNHIFTEQYDENPLEVKAYISAEPEPRRTMEYAKLQITGYMIYLIIPFVAMIFAVYVIMLGFELLKNKKENEEDYSVKKLIKDGISYFNQHIPQILTFYLIAFKFMTLYLNDSSMNTLNIILTVVFVALCGIYVLCYTLKDIKWKYFIFYSLLAIFVAALCKDVAFVMLIALGACYINKGTKPFLQALCISIGLFFVLTPVLCGYEVLENKIYNIWGDVDIIGIRHSFGFGNPNTVSLFLFVFTSCLISYKKPTIVVQLLLLGLTAVVYYFTYSRTGCFCVIILIVGDAVTNLLNIKGKWRYIFVVIFPLFTILTYVMSIHFETFYKINKLLSNRLSIMNAYLQLDNWINLRGMDQLTGMSYVHPIDNLYFNVLILQGLPCFIVYMWIYMIASYRIVESGNNSLLAVLISYFIYSLFEATLMSYSCAFIVAILFISEFSKKYTIDGGVKSEYCLY